MNYKKLGVRPPDKVATICLENTDKLRGLQSNATKIETPDGVFWQPVRPVPGFFFRTWKARIRGAWLVLIGKAEFIRWF